MNKKELIKEIAVVIADEDRGYDYECAFIDLPESERKYFESLSEKIINEIETWCDIKYDGVDEE